MKRCVLMIEVDNTDGDATERLTELLPDAAIWGDIDPVQASLMVLDRSLNAA